MVSKGNTAIVMRYALSFILASALIFSFGLHSVQIDHVHFNAVHSHTEEHKSKFASLETYMHLSEKKLFLFIPVAVLLSSFLAYEAFLLRIIVLRLANWYAHMMRRRNALHGRTYDYHSYFFRKGVFHSRAY